MAKTARSGREEEKPHRRKIDRVEPRAEIKMTFVTLVRSQRAERRTTPGMEAVLSRETRREDCRGERCKVRA